MTYDPRDHALHGNEIVAALSLWFLVVLAGCLVPRPFEAASNRMVQHVSPSWSGAMLCIDDRAS